MRRTLFICLLVGALMAFALPARACSCAIGDARDRLAAADGAIVGTLLAKQPHADDPYVSTYVFRVDEAVKGEFGPTVDVNGSTDGASCGIEVPIGGETGLFLSLDDDEWWSSLCQQIDPDELREAAEPMPEPDGKGPIKMLIGGSWGEMGIIAVDSEGRTLSYGERKSGSRWMEMCPGSQRFVEIYGHWRRPKLAVRDTSTMAVIRQTPLPHMATPYKWADAVWSDCRDPEANEIILTGVHYNEPRSKGYLFSVTPDGVEEIYAGSAGSFSFDGGTAWLTEGRYGRSIRKLDLVTMKKRKIARVPRHPGLIYPSPDGSKLAIATGGDHQRLIVIDLTAGKSDRKTVKAMPGGSAGELHWIDNDSLTYLPGGYDNSTVELYSASLEKQDEFDGHWYTRANALFDGAAYGLGWGVLHRAVLPGGPAEVLREFPSAELYSMTPVPDEVFATSD